jgi:hypothetical protein
MVVLDSRSDRTQTHSVEHYSTGFFGLYQRWSVKKRRQKNTKIEQTNPISNPAKSPNSFESNWLLKAGGRKLHVKNEPN